MSAEPKGKLHADICLPELASLASRLKAAEEERDAIADKLEAALKVRFESYWKMADAIKDLLFQLRSNPLARARSLGATPAEGEKR